MRKIFDSIKKTSLSLKVGSLFILSLFVLLFIFGLINGEFYVVLGMQEIDTTNAIYGFHFTYKNVAKILLMGPVWCMMMYWYITKMINNIEVYDNQGLDEKATNKMKGQLNFILVLLIALNITGHTIHWIADTASGSYDEQFDTYIGESQSLNYFSDEFLSHGIIHSTYFFMLIIIFLAEFYKGKESKQKVKGIEWIMVIIIFCGIIGINGVAALSGESAVLLLILSICGVMLIILLFLSRKAPILHYPFALSMLLGSIGVIFYICIVVATTDTLPFYPYFT